MIDKDKLTSDIAEAVGLAAGPKGGPDPTRNSGFAGLVAALPHLVREINTLERRIDGLASHPPGEHAAPGGPWVSWVQDTVRVLTASLGETIEAVNGLHVRLSELDGERTMRFEGPHDPAKQYSAGAVVQRQGATWVAMMATAEVPGSSGHWRRLTGGAQ